MQHGLGSEFSAKVNGLATDFALRAIKAQPFDYLRTIWDATTRTFQPASYASKLYVFPAALRAVCWPCTPVSLNALGAVNHSDFRDEYTYNNGGDPNTRGGEPFPGWVRFYQRLLLLPPPALAVILFAGLMGIPLARRVLRRPALPTWADGLRVHMAGPPNP